MSLMSRRNFLERGAVTAVTVSSLDSLTRMEVGNAQIQENLDAGKTLKVGDINRTVELPWQENISARNFPEMSAAEFRDSGLVALESAMIVWVVGNSRDLVLAAQTAMPAGGKLEMRVFYPDHTSVSVFSIITQDLRHGDHIALPVNKLDAVLGSRGLSKFNIGHGRVEILYQPVSSQADASIGFLAKDFNFPLEGQQSAMPSPNIYKNIVTYLPVSEGVVTEGVLLGVKADGVEDASAVLSFNGKHAGELWVARDNGKWVYFYPFTEVNRTANGRNEGFVPETLLGVRDGFGNCDSRVVNIFPTQQNRSAGTGVVIGRSSNTETSFGSLSVDPQYSNLSWVRIN